MSAATVQVPRDLASQLAAIEAAADADRKARERAAAERDAERAAGHNGARRWRLVARKARDDGRAAPTTSRADDAPEPESLRAALGELAARPLDDRVAPQIRDLLDRATTPMVRAALTRGVGPARPPGAHLHLVPPAGDPMLPAATAGAAPAARPPLAHATEPRDAHNTCGLGSAAGGAQSSHLPVPKGVKE